ncbi:MAG: VanZ family protein [Cellvibrionaceae bacterium]
MFNANHQQNNRLLRIYFVGGWFQFVLFLSVITFLSLTPNPGSAFEHASDKVLHVIGWSCMAISLGVPWLVSVVFNQKTLFYHLQRYSISVVFLFLYSIIIEVVQQYTGRQFSGLDIVANAVGVLIGVLVVRLFFNMKMKHKIG